MTASTRNRWVADRPNGPSSTHRSNRGPSSTHRLSVEIDELRVDADALHGSADELATGVRRALEQLVADRGLPTRPSTASRGSPEPRDDAALAAHIAEAVWQRLVIP